MIASVAAVDGPHSAQRVAALVGGNLDIGETTAEGNVRIGADVCINAAPPAPEKRAIRAEPGILVGTRDAADSKIWGTVPVGLAWRRSPDRQQGG